MANTPSCRLLIKPLHILTTIKNQQRLSCSATELIRGSEADFKMIVLVLQPVSIAHLSTAPALASLPDIQTIGLDEEALINLPWKEKQQ